MAGHDWPMHNGAVVRADTIVDCRQRNSGLNCREF